MASEQQLTDSDVIKLPTEMQVKEEKLYTSIGSSRMVGINRNHV